VSRDGSRQFCLRIIAISTMYLTPVHGCSGEKAGGKRHTEAIMIDEAMTHFFGY
jgi:hypothetical protein